MSFRIDGSLLAERYLAMQQALHPDRYAAAGDQEKRLSMQASIRINEAFQTLKDPLERARYMLSLLTGEASGEKETTQDITFLMEQMELREELAAVRGQSDAHIAVGKILGRLSDQSGALIEDLETLLEAPSASDLETAQELVRKLQFVAKCRAEAENLAADLDEVL